MIPNKKEGVNTYMNPQDISSALSINESGHLTIGGCDTVSLAETYGTPLYVMDESLIRHTLRAYKASLDTHYINGGTVAFASKACSFMELYRIINSEGCSADVVSGGELYTAVQAGLPAERIFFHGNNKTEAELRMALSYGVGHIVLDNMEEARRLSRIARSMEVSSNVLMRITPGIDAHTHDFVKTGQIDCKFGFTLENGNAMQSVGEVLSLPNLCLKGFHCHIGSQIFDEEPFGTAAEVMMQFMADVREKYNVVMPMLNLGGGFGIKYTDDERPIACGEFMGPVAKTLQACADRLQYPVPHIVIEPGRSVVAPAGITLYTIGSVKTIPNVRTYVSVDGGMADNPRYALYQANYSAVIANKVNLPADQTVTIAGRCCESGDLLQEHTPLQQCEEGDILAVLATGAYNYSMASHYNRLPNPAVVMVSDGGSRVVVKAETYEDIIKNDI